MIETSKSKVGYLALSLALGGAMATGAAYGIDAMWVDTAGNVGVGINTPVAPLHVERSTGTAADLVHLTNNGGSFVTLENTATGNSWYLVHEHNVAGRFMVNSSAHSGPLLALTNQGDLTVPGNVGIGASASDPLATLLVARSNWAGPQDNILRLENTSTNPSSAARLLLRNSRIIASSTNDPDWTFNSNGTLRITAGMDAAELILDAAGNMTILRNLVTGGPICGGGCDVVLSPGYQLDSIEAHAAKMWAESYLPAVGPTPEGGAGFNLTEKTGGILSELEKAHIYIEQINDQVKTLTAENRGQQQTIQALREELREQDAAQAALMRKLEERLAALEASGHRGSQ